MSTHTSRYDIQNKQKNKQTKQSPLPPKRYENIDKSLKKKHLSWFLLSEQVELYSGNVYTDVTIQNLVLYIMICSSFVLSVE